MLAGIAGNGQDITLRVVRRPLGLNASAKFAEVSSSTASGGKGHVTLGNLNTVDGQYVLVVGSSQNELIEGFLLN